MNKTEKQEETLTPGAKAAWRLLLASLSGAVILALASWFLYTGLDVAYKYGVPRTSYGESMRLLFGVLGIGMGFWFTRPTPSAPSPTIYVVTKEEA